MLRMRPAHRLRHVLLAADSRARARGACRPRPLARRGRRASQPLRCDKLLKQLAAALGLVIFDRAPATAATSWRAPAASRSARRRLSDALEGPVAAHRLLRGTR